MYEKFITDLALEYECYGTRDWLNHLAMLNLNFNIAHKCIQWICWNLWACILWHIFIHIWRLLLFDIFSELLSFFQKGSLQMKARTLSTKSICVVLKEYEPSLKDVADKPIQCLRMIVLQFGIFFAGDVLIRNLKKAQIKEPIFFTTLKRWTEQLAEFGVQQKYFSAIFVLPLAPYLPISPERLLPVCCGLIIIFLHFDFLVSRLANKIQVRNVCICSDISLAFCFEK